MILFASATILLVQSADYPVPERVKVLPVFFVPSDQSPPTRDQSARYMRHLKWARDRFSEMLGGRATFELAKEEPDVYRAAYPLLAYRPLPEDAAPRLVEELLRQYGTDRFRCPYIFAIILMNPCENHPAGGGRPFNGGHDRGGGLLEISSWALDSSPNFQSTLQHELGHSIGLVHVDAYGYSMETNDSIMSYNPKHHTRGFEPSPTPGRLIPEDLRALAKNSRVLPGLTFRGDRDVPREYTIRAEKSLGPMTLGDEAPWIDDPKQRSRDSVGYELFENGRRTKHEPTWNRAAALQDLSTRKGGEGRHNGRVIHAGAAGYELFLDGKRAGHEPKWTLSQGIENLRWNRKDKPGRDVEARFEGVPILLWESAGYELFFDGVRVGHEPKFTREQAVENLRWNRKNQEKKVVEGRFNGERIP
jgi:hypothetical protein